MQSTKLLLVWENLAIAEKRDLRQWLALQGVRDDVQQLYDFLYENSTKNTSDFSKKAAFQAVYGAVDYNDNWLRHAQSFLIKEIEAFLVRGNPALAAPSIATNLATAKMYLKRGLEKPFLQVFRLLRSDLATANLRDAAYLRQAAETEDCWSLYLAEQPPTEQNTVQDLLLAQEKAFAAEQIRAVCTALSYQNRFKLQYDFGLLNALLLRIEQQNWHETEPAIGAYYAIYKLNTAEQTAVFWAAFRQKLPDYQACFSHDEYQLIYIGAVNYAIKQSNKGIEAFFRELFDLYKNGIENGVLREKNKELSAYTYKNMVATGLRVGETAYIRTFIETYKEALPFAQRQSYYEYNLARYYFAVRDMTNAQPLLLNLTYGDIFLQLGAKVMLLKMYYEQEELDALDVHLRSFKQFLHRKRATLGYHQQNYENIIQCVKRLMAHNPFDKEERAALRTEITDLQPLTERAWLLACL